MNKTTFAIIIGIIAAGFIAGIFSGVGIKTGITPDESGISLEILKSFCTESENIDKTMAYNCWNYYIIVFIGNIFLVIGNIIATASQMKDWKIGLFLYALGWILGVLGVFGVLH